MRSFIYILLALGIMFTGCIRKRPEPVTYEGYVFSKTDQKTPLAGVKVTLKACDKKGAKWMSIAINPAVLLAKRLAMHRGIFL